MNISEQWDGLIDWCQDLNRKLNPYSKDFYIARVGLAAYFEKDWSDLFLTPEQVPFDFPAFDLKHLSHQDSLHVSKTILDLLEKENQQPASYLEIGPGLGRVFYEIKTKTPSLKQARLVEPSKLLATGLTDLFKGYTKSVFPLVFGNEYLSEVTIDPSQISEQFRNFDLEIINKPFSRAKDEVASADLVMCLNVVDQCKNPAALIKLVKAKTNINGMLAISCTFLWQKKHPWSKKAPFKNLRSQFGNDWEILAEENVPFSIRVNERYWYTFLSQVLYLKRVS